jgi:hypothetical protein
MVADDLLVGNDLSTVISWPLTPVRRGWTQYARARSLRRCGVLRTGVRLVADSVRRLPRLRQLQQTLPPT